MLTGEPTGTVWELDETIRREPRMVVEVSHQHPHSLGAFIPYLPIFINYTRMVVFEFEKGIGAILLRSALVL